MINSRLSVPEPTQKASAFLDVRPRQIHAWLRELPTANVHETGRQALLALAEVNKVRMAPHQRLQVAELFRPVVADVTRVLKRGYANGPCPMEDRHRPTAFRVRDLLVHLANGYKLVVAELTRDGRRVRGEDRDLAAALRWALDALAQVLVEHYETYLAEPAGLWGELHALYHLAERHHLQNLTEPAREGRGGEHSIAHRYRRIILLALANPYHLMPGESARIYTQLDAWADRARLLPLPPGEALSGRFFVDLATDSGPRFARRQTRIQPIQGRLVDSGPLVQVLNDLAADIDAAPRNDPRRRHTTLTERLERDMYVRLARSWGTRPERMAERHTHLTRVQMVTGLSTCHDLFAGHLAIVSEPPAPHPPHPPNPRGHRGENVHVMVQSATAANASGAEQETPVYVAVPWHQRNESPGGLALFCFLGCKEPVRVGEVVAFRPGDGAQPAEWRLGVVRWARAKPDEGVELGIQTLADDAGPTRTRAVEGVGKGGESIKGLVIPDLDPTEHPTTLITPPAIYDEDSVLVLRAAGHTLSVRLTRLVEATKRYSQFRFEVLDTPPPAVDEEKPAPFGSQPLSGDSLPSFFSGER